MTGHMRVEQVATCRGIRSYIDRHLYDAGPRGEGLTWLGYGEVPELQAIIAASPTRWATLTG